MRIIGLIILLFICQNIFPQTAAPVYRNVVPLSPDASAIQKYGNTPVSLYTGTPQIDIPLYDINIPDFKLPISLSYHAGGIKVNEEASNVGLGWTLQAGGVITRQMNGNDDFKNPRGYIYNSYNQYFNESNYYAVRANNNILNDVSECIYSLGGISLNLNDYLYSLEFGVHWDYYDLEPDIFSYSFSGYSGKFFINKQKKAIKEKPDALDIQLIETDGIKFQFTTPDGVKYLFDVPESSVFTTAESGTNTSYITAWYLGKITTPTNNEITFTYTSLPNDTYQNYSDISQRKILYVYGPFFSSGGNCSGYDQSILSTFLPNRTYQIKSLSSISFNHGSIAFEYGSRLDMKGNRKVEKLNVRNGNNETVFYYALKYDYFNANFFLGQSVPVTAGYNNDLLFKRLKLIGLEKQVGINPIEKYQFTYNETSLPAKNSYSRDYWGYFNGKSNSSLISSMYYVNPSFYGFVGRYEGASREPDPNFVQAFLLKDITYPTGGKTIYEFESNEYHLSNSTNLGEATSILKGTSSFLSRRGETNNFLLKTTPLLGGTNIKLKLRSVSGQSYPLPHNQNDAYLEFYPIGSSSYISRIPIGEEAIWINNGNNEFTLETPIYLTGGSYTVKVVIGSNVLFLNYVELTFEWFYNELAENPNKTKIGAGVRVKKITDYSGPGNQNIVRKFLYSEIVDIMGTPTEVSHGRKIPSLKIVNNALAGQCSQTAIYSDNCISGSNLIVGYDKVITLYGENGENGRSESEFFNEIDWNLEFKYEEANIALVPNGISQLTSVTNGLSKRKVEYKHDAVSNTYRQIQEELYTYSIPPPKTLIGIRHVAWAYVSGSFYNQHCQAIVCRYPIMQSQWTPLIKTVVKQYNPETNALQSVFQKDYQYENTEPKHFLPLKVEQKRSDGGKSQIFTTYPSDYLPGTPFLDGMRQKNIVLPIENVSTIEDNNGNIKIVKGTILKYNINNPSLLEAIETTEQNASIPLSNFKFSNRTIGVLPTTGTPTSFAKDQLYKNAFSFTYDPNYNLSQQTKANDILKSYIWSYGNSLPVSEVMNAKSNEIFHDNFEELTGWDGSLSAYDNSRSKTGKYSGRIDKLDAYEQTSHSSKWLTVSLTSPKKFRYSTWVYSDGPTAEIFLFMKRANETGYFSYVDQVACHETNKWVLIEKDFTVPADVTQLGIRIDNNGGGTVWFDDVRLHPSDAMMTTYTYKPLVGMTSQTDANNRTVYYEYDSFNRLYLVRDQDGKILKKYCYNYAGQQTDCSVDVTALWTATGIYDCELDGNSNNTGNQLRQERDNNPNSSTYNNTRWVFHGYNPTICPIPVTCDEYTCQNNGPEYRCVYGACEQGFRMNIFSYYDWESGMYICEYRYEWSDGDWSPTYYEYNWGHCPY